MLPTPPRSATATCLIDVTSKTGASFPCPPLHSCLERTDLPPGCLYFTGAKTPLAQFVCGWVVGFVLLFLTTYFARVPTNILGSIIICSVASLVEYEQIIYLWKVNKLDLLCWLAGESHGYLLQFLNLLYSMSGTLTDLSSSLFPSILRRALLQRGSGPSNLHRPRSDARCVPSRLPTHSGSREIVCLFECIQVSVHSSCCRLNHQCINAFITYASSLQLQLILLVLYIFVGTSSNTLMPRWSLGCSPSELVSPIHNGWGSDITCTGCGAPIQGGNRCWQHDLRFPVPLGPGALPWSKDGGSCEN